MKFEWKTAIKEGFGALGFGVYASRVGGALSSAIINNGVDIREMSEYGNYITYPFVLGAMAGIIGENTMHTPGNWSYKGIIGVGLTTYVTHFAGACLGYAMIDSDNVFDDFITNVSFSSVVPTLTAGVISSVGYVGYTLYSKCKIPNVDSITSMEQNYPSTVQNSNLNREVCIGIPASALPAETESESHNTSRFFQPRPVGNNTNAKNIKGPAV